MGQFAGIGILLIIGDFILIALGVLNMSKNGSFEFQDLKIAGPVWFIILMFGIVLVIIP